MKTGNPSLNLPQPGGGPPRQWMAVTGKTGKNKKAKTAKRQTPMDKKMANDIRFVRDVGESAKNPPRKATA